MNRKDFGLWGLELAPPDFARALAALGVFQGSLEHWPSSLSVAAIKNALTKAARQRKGLLPWQLSVVPLAELDKPKLAESAQLFAVAWAKFAKSQKNRMRFELHLDSLGDYFWIADKLRSTAVASFSSPRVNEKPDITPAALYVRADKPQSVVGWNWPLRIGFLENNTSQRLRKQLEQGFNASSLNKLVTFVELVNESDECDLLLSPHDLRGTLYELLKVEWRPRADCVLVLGGGQRFSNRLTALIQAVRTEARTSGVGLLSVAEDQRVRWLTHLITQLSHNNSLDVALFLTEQEPDVPPPLLVASRSLIELTLISRSANRLSNALKRTVKENRMARRRVLGPSGGSFWGKGGLPLKEPPSFLQPDWSPKDSIKTKGGGSISGKGGPPLKESPPFLGGWGAKTAKKKDAGGGGRRSIRHDSKAKLVRVANRLARVDDWLQESGGATTVVDSNRTAETLVKKVPLPYEDRRIQARVFDHSGKEQQRRALKWRTSYVVDVRIGLLDEQWESAEKPFPVDELPPSDKGHDLTVVFTEPHVSPEPQVGKLFLPARGTTVPCRFYFRTTNSSHPISARITVLHRNRVIQTAILEAPVFGSRPPQNAKIKVRIEARVLPGIDNLRDRQSFDTAVVLNHANDGRAYGTAISGEEAVMFSLDEAGLKQTIQTLNDELTYLADDPDSYSKDIEDAANTDLLRTLAIHGRLLYKNLFVYRPENAWFVGKDKKRIQIISTRRESNLPLEFLYDYEAPKDNAKLCRYAKKSLSKGECDKACGGPKKKQNIVCPLGFWGLNRVIERHAYDGTRNLQGNTYALKAVSTTQRKPLQVLDSALFAASGEVDKAKKGTINALGKLLKQKAKQANYVSKWSEWVKQVKSNSPSLLLLLSHTEDDPLQGNMPALEIAQLPRLRVVDIDEKHVRRSRSKATPVVMLIGCKTNAPDNPLHNCVLAFSTYSAIVLSTGATILALQAGRVAAELVRALASLPKNKDGSLGEVMLDLRRRLLAKGLPMVLTLSAYGDADWKLN